MKRLLIVAAMVLGIAGCEIRAYPERPHVIAYHEPAPPSYIYVDTSEPIYTYFNYSDEYCYGEWDEWGECIVDYCWDEWYDIWYVYSVDCIF
jgi:hypothetical protein